MLGNSPTDAFHAQLLRQWSDDVTLLVPAPQHLTDDERADLAGRDIEVVEGDVSTLARGDGGRLHGVAMRDGRVVPCDAVFVWAPPAPTDGLLRDVGVPARELPPFGSWPEVGPDGRTEVAGVGGSARAEQDRP